MTIPHRDIPASIALVTLLAGAIAFIVVAVVNCFKQVCDKGAERDRPDGYRGEDVLP